MHRITVLIVDDDPGINSIISTYLEAEGWKTISAFTAKQATEYFDKFSPDIVLLDLLLPDMHGREVFLHIRERAQTPVLILSAVRALEDQIDCLNMGADDYLSKPKDIREVAARLRAVMRRCHIGDFAPTRFAAGGLNIDYESRQVFSSGRKANLTRVEFDILETLCRNAGKMLTYEEILRNAWGPRHYLTKRDLQVHIRHLRQKIEPDHMKPRHIINCAEPATCSKHRLPQLPLSTTNSSL